MELGHYNIEINGTLMVRPNSVVTSFEECLGGLQKFLVTKYSLSEADVIIKL